MTYKFLDGKVYVYVLSQFTMVLKLSLYSISNIVYIYACVNINI